MEKTVSVQFCVEQKVQKGFGRNFSLVLCLGWGGGTIRIG